jgi:tRNA 2-thiocytidine biosynthesis protein TtcA
MSTSVRKQQFEAQRLQKRLRHQVGRAIGDYGLIAEGDKVMVCLSGGKDSYTLLDLLLQLKAKAPVRFELEAVHLDQKQPDYDPEVLPRYLRSIGVPFRVLEQDTYSVVKRVVPEGKTMCGLCSRLRRGALYRHAAENGFTKIALGHHRDDIVETLFLNLFFHGRLAAIPPKLLSDDGKHVVIRPLACCAESDRRRRCSARRSRPCCRNGSARSLGGSTISSGRSRMYAHPSSPIAACSISLRSVKRIRAQTRALGSVARARPRRPRPRMRRASTAFQKMPRPAE